MWEQNEQESFSRRTSYGSFSLRLPEVAGNPVCGNKSRSANASKGGASCFFGLRAQHHTIAPFLFGLVHCNVCTPQHLHPVSLPGLQRAYANACRKANLLLADRDPQRSQFTA